MNEKIEPWSLTLNLIYIEELDLRDTIRWKFGRKEEENQRFWSWIGNRFEKEKERKFERILSLEKNGSFVCEK